MPRLNHGGQFRVFAFLNVRRLGKYLGAHGVVMHNVAHEVVVEVAHGVPKARHALVEILVVESVRDDSLVVS